MSDSFATTWTAAHQAPRSMEFFRQVFWSGLLFASPGDQPVSPVSPALVGKFFTTAPQISLLKGMHTHTHTHTPYSELSQKDGKDEESYNMF